MQDLFRHFYLIRQLVIRETVSRYKGSMLGLIWMIVNPLIMLGVYTFIFGVVFRIPWGGATADVSRDSPGSTMALLFGLDLRVPWGSSPFDASNGSMAGYAMHLFCGLIVFNLFSESVMRAPALIVNNANYAKKMIFPLEVFPISVVGASLLHCAVGTLILLLGVGILLKSISFTLFLFPLVLLPHLLLTLGICWFLASLGVILRDIGQAIMVIVQILFFMTPIFYPIDLVPESLRFVMRLNPLAIAVDSARRTLILGQWPDWPWMAGLLVFSVILAKAGYSWFMKTKRGFADVL